MKAVHGKYRGTDNEQRKDGICVSLVRDKAELESGQRRRIKSGEAQRTDKR